VAVELEVARTRIRLPTGSFVPSIAAMLEFLHTRRETLLRMMRFLVVGGGSLGVQLAVLWALAGRMNETLAFSISWVVSTATHYFANRYWALPSTRHDASKQFGEYLFTVALSWVINTAAFKLFRAAGMNEYWAATCAVPPSTIVVFLMLNYRVFRAKPDA
jgi:putative flippase GtrA